MNNASLILEHLRPAIRKVLGFQDYKEQEQLLVRVDEILRGNGVEKLEREGEAGQRGEGQGERNCAGGLGRAQREGITMNECHATIV